MADQGGIGGLMPHSSSQQHAAQYSPLAQPRGVANGGGAAAASQYIGVPQPYFFHPTLNAFFPGPPPPRHSYLMSSTTAPPPAAPPPAALPLCHSHHVTGRTAAAPAAAAAPSPPPGAPSGIPAAPPDAPPGFILSNVCIPPSFSSVAVLPPGAHERLASSAAVPAPPADDAGATALGKGTAAGTGGRAHPYPGQQQTAAGVGKATGAAAVAHSNRITAGGGGGGRVSSGREEGSSHRDMRPNQSNTNTPPPPPKTVAGPSNEGTARTLSPPTSSAAEEPSGGRDGTAARRDSTATGAGGASARCGTATTTLQQHSGTHSRMSVGLASIETGRFENKVGGSGTDEQRRTLQSEPSSGINRHVPSCAATTMRSGEARSINVGSTQQPCHQDRLGYVGGGDKEDRQARPSTHSPDSRNIGGRPDIQRFDNCFLKTNIAQQNMQQHDGPVVDGTRPAGGFRRMGVQGGIIEGKSVSSFTTGFEKPEEKRGELDQGGSLSCPRNHRGEIDKIGGASATVGAAAGGKASSMPFTGRGVTGGGGVGGVVREDGAEPMIRSAGAVGAASFTKQERVFGDKKPAADVSGEGAAGKDEHEEGRTVASPEAAADQNRGPNNSTDGRFPFTTGGETFGPSGGSVGGSRVLRSSSSSSAQDNSGRGRIVVGNSSMGQPLPPPPRKQQQQQQHQGGGGPFQQRHPPQREQPLYTRSRRGTSSSSLSAAPSSGGVGAGRGVVRPHGYGGGATGGHPHPAGFNSRQSPGVGGLRPPATATGGFAVGGSRRSGGIGGGRTGCERERDANRVGKRRRRSSSGDRHMSEGRDTRSRCSSSVERRRRRSSPSIQRPVNEDVRSRSRSSSIASLVLGEEETLGGERRSAGGGGAAKPAGGEGSTADEGRDGQMEFQRNQSHPMDRRRSLSPGDAATRSSGGGAGSGGVSGAGGRSSISPSPASDVFMDVQEAEACNSSTSNSSGMASSGGMMVQRERNGKRISEDDGAQSRKDLSRSRTHHGCSSTRCSSRERNTGVLLEAAAAAECSTYPPPPPRPPSPRGQATQPDAAFSLGANAFSHPAGSSASVWMGKTKTAGAGAAAGAAATGAAGGAGAAASGGGAGGGGEGQGEAVADAPGVTHAEDAVACRVGGGASASAMAPSTQIGEGVPSTVRGPLFDLWVPTTFHPMCPERVRLVLGPKGRTHKEMEQFTKTRVQVYGRELVRDTSKHEYDPFRDNQPLHLVVGDKVRRGEWTDASIQEMKEKLKMFLELLVQRTWPRTEPRQPVSFYDKQVHLGPSSGPVVYVDPLGNWDESPPRDLFPCLIYNPTMHCTGSSIVSANQQSPAGIVTAPTTTTPEGSSSSVIVGESEARLQRRAHDEDIGSTYEGDTSLLLNCTPPLCLLLLTLQAAHGLLVEEGAQDLVRLPLLFEKKWDVRFLFRREDFQAAGPSSFTTERKEVLTAAVDSLIYTPEGHMHEEAVSILTRFVKEFPEVFDCIEEDMPAPAPNSAIPGPPAHSTLKIKARDQPDFASVAERFKSMDPWLQGGQPLQTGMSL